MRGLLGVAVCLFAVKCVLAIPTQMKADAQAPASAHGSQAAPDHAEAISTFVRRLSETMTYTCTESTCKNGAGSCAECGPSECAFGCAYCEEECEQDVDTWRTRFKGHSDLVISAAMSTNGRSLVTGSYDSTARIWDATTGVELLLFEGHTDIVCAVAVSAGGNLVVTGSWDKTARIWDATNGEERARLEGHTGIVTSVAISPDASSVVTGGKDNTAMIWDADTGAEQLRIEGHVHVHCVTFSPDGDLVITGGLDRTARISDATTGAEKLRLEGHTAIVTSVSITRHSDIVVTGCDDGTARIWDARTGEEKLLIRSTEGPQGLPVAISPDGVFVVTGSGHTDTLRIWGAASGELWQSFTASDSEVCRNLIDASAQDTCKTPRRRYVASVAVSSDAGAVVAGIGCCAWILDVETPPPTPSPTPSPTPNPPTPSPTPNPTRKPPTCEGWCESHMDDWTKKCTWRDCEACTQCTEDSSTSFILLLTLGVVVVLCLAFFARLVVARGGTLRRPAPLTTGPSTALPTVHGSSAAS